MNVIKFDFQDMVTLNGNEVMTTSLKVAEHFGKRHADILRAIKNIGCSKEFSERNFASADYIDEQGKLRPMFKMTKDGFTFLVMGFTGKAADQIKESYINAFNWMAEQLNRLQVNFMQEQNSVMLEYMKEKDVASLSGRLLNKWGRKTKPALQARMKQLESQSQIKLLL